MVMSCHHFAREPAKSIIFAFNNNLLRMTKEINRLKAVLAEVGKTNVWLAEQLGVNPTTVSKWCTNTCQPDLHTLSRIAELLNVSRRELLRP
jgi:toxin-antitoxin system, antitoxin component, xre family